MGLRVIFASFTLLVILVAGMVTWILRPEFIPNWSAAALDVGATGNCVRAERIFSEVSAAGAGGVKHIAEQMTAQGHCTHIDPAVVAGPNDDQKPELFSLGGPIFDPELEAPNRSSLLQIKWWQRQHLYMTCWRRFDPDHRVDTARIQAAISQPAETDTSDWARQRAACAQRHYDDVIDRFNTHGFTFEKGQVAYRLLLRAERLGHAMGTYLRAKMIIDDDWRFRKVDVSDKEGYETLYRAAQAGYPPAEKKLAMALVEGDAIRLPDEQTYFWLARAWRSWEAHDGKLERMLRRYGRKVGKEFPPSDIPAETLKEKSESVPPELL